jgi:adenine-specific DNA-methyltransferase
MGIEFLGHKQNILSFILDNVLYGREKRVADLFSGTGSVSAGFKRAGCSVVANDNLEWCGVFAKAILFNNVEPSFHGLESSVRFDHTDTQSRYETVLSALNDIAGAEGFVTKTYSPASRRYSEHERMYFTESNAQRIDGIRQQLVCWSDLMTPGENSLLLSDLIRAANSVSNIAGAYGCYLKSWKARALQPLKLSRSEIVTGSHASHSVTCLDAEVLASQINCPVVYADPPYTKRQYAAYYHVLQTIALGDSPEVTGSTGLRSWREKSSAYCYKRTAGEALLGLVSALSCEDFFLSYSEDGQIKHNVIMEILSGFGKTRFFELEHKRYKSSSLPHKGAIVRERLYHLKAS